MRDKAPKRMYAFSAKETSKGNLCAPYFRKALKGALRAYTPPKQPVILFRKKFERLALFKRNLIFSGFPWVSFERCLQKNMGARRISAFGALFLERQGLCKKKTSSNRFLRRFPFICPKALHSFPSAFGISFALLVNLFRLR